MNPLLFETSRIKVSNLCRKNYENVTKLYMDYRENCLATGVFGETTPEDIQKRIYDSPKNSILHLFVAESREESAFIGFCKTSLHPEKKVVWIHAFIIVSELRHQGFGTEFLEGICDYFKATSGFDQIILSVAEGNIVAETFWKRNKFYKNKKLSNARTERSLLDSVNIFVKEY